MHARDLTLDKFIDAPTLSVAPTLPRAGSQARTVLLTGATGFLGRYLALHWLDRMARVDGTLICLVRAHSDEDARRRLHQTFDSGDPELLRHFEELADHLEVIAGDKGEANLGLDPQTWQRLAETAATPSCCGTSRNSPIISRSSPATRAKPTWAWTPRPGSGWPRPSI
ncbi:SDR family oxidoreductase [Mycobacterium paraseoulense]|nr:SDR family oxidoreductase [Mycobacterium paraseoulense]